MYLAYSLQKKYGKDRVVVLKENHEQWFLVFLYEGADEWLAEDENNRTTATFLSEEELAEIRGMAYRESLYSLKDKIKKRNKELLIWLKKLPLFYEKVTVKLCKNSGNDMKK